MIGKDGLFLYQEYFPVGVLQQRGPAVMFFTQQGEATAVAEQDKAPGANGAKSFKGGD